MSAGAETSSETASRKRFQRIASKRLEGKRLDRYLVLSGIGISRNKVSGLIETGKVLVNGRRVKPSYRIRPGDEIAAELEPEPAITIEPVQMDLSIVYEDEAVIVIDKPAGLVVHPARGNWTNTLVNGLLYHCQHLPPRFDSPLRPGVVHRLDKDTTGLLVFAKTDAALRDLGSQIEHRTVVREYLAFAWGDLERSSGTIDAPIGRHTIDRLRMAVTPFAARNAITSYEVLRRYSVCTYLRLRLKTGRTHQIRVHLQHIGHPVVGDPEYGGRSPAVLTQKEHLPVLKEILTIVHRQALHATRLGFVHPQTKKYLEFISPLPPDLERLFLFLEELSRQRKI